MISLPLFTMNFDLILTTFFTKHITECLTEIDYSQRNAACEIEKIYHCEDFEDPLSFVQKNQNEDKGVTYVSGSTGLS